MSACELCGKDTQLCTAVVEGSHVNVCMPCARFGRIVRKPVVQASKPAVPIKGAPEVMEIVVPNFAQLIRGAREKLGMTQKDFARFLNEKESIVQKLENGSFVPPINMAKKLEKLLHIKLVEAEQEEKAETSKKGSGPLTIGDIIQMKK